ncbi:hypothetical protein ASF96_02995 [Microbacterium sp. Leaf179]|nr:hypothetical protein ASF96_02995 [Microbacterium sp. Leaf179]
MIARPHFDGATVGMLAASKQLHCPNARARMRSWSVRRHCGELGPCEGLAHKRRYVQEHIRVEHDEEAPRVDVGLRFRHS